MLTRTPLKYIYTAYGLNHRLIYALVTTPYVILWFKCLNQDAKYPAHTQQQPKQKK